MVGRRVCLLLVWGNICLLCAHSGFGVVFCCKRWEAGSRQNTKAVASRLTAGLLTAFADFQVSLDEYQTALFPGPKTQAP